MTSAQEPRFRMLVCIDGSDESYRGVRYASRLGRGSDAEITLIYVRPFEQPLQMGGLKGRVASENILEWGLELPGIQHLKRGRDLLVSIGELNDDWKQTTVREEVQGDPLGDIEMTYHDDQGKRTRLVLKSARDIVEAILGYQEKRGHDIIIIGASDRWPAMRWFRGAGSVAQKVATNAPCSVIVARELEEGHGHGHLICLDGTEASYDLIRKDAQIAVRCQCPISLLSVAPTEDDREEAERIIAEGRKLLLSLGVHPAGTMVEVGDPVKVIANVGSRHSLTIVAPTQKTGLAQFLGSISGALVSDAKSSVMILR